MLAPFQYDAERALITRAIRLHTGKIVHMKIRGTVPRTLLVDVESSRIVTSSERNQAIEITQRMFGLDHDLRPFYTLMSRTPRYEWVSERKAGRMFTCPTIWEDLVKTLFTTNTSWSNTISMVKNLVALDPDGVFPTAQQIAVYSEAELAEKTGIGYRAPYLHALAQQILAGVDVEAWATLDSAALYKAVTALKGFGDYAAGTMLRLLGHYDRLAVDSVARKAFEQVSANEAATEADLRAYYEPFGEWRGLVLWMDCIRDEYSA